MPIQKSGLTQRARGRRESYRQNELVLALSSFVSQANPVPPAAGNASRWAAQLYLISRRGEAIEYGRKKRNPFKLRDFRGVDPECIAKLEAIGLKNAEQLLAAGSTKKQRSTLAKEANVPQSILLELVKLSDLARLPGVKGIRARLYYDAGVDSVAKMATWEPEALRKMVTRFAERTGFDGIPPLPKEVSSTVANAKELPKMMEE